MPKSDIVETNIQLVELCVKTHKIGHYSAKCFTKSVPSVPDQMKDSSSIAYLDTIGSDDQKSWTISMSWEPKW